MPRKQKFIKVSEANEVEQVPDIDKIDENNEIPDELSYIINEVPEDVPEVVIDPANGITK